ncbi:MAG TPA: hypothetical protein VFZ70_01440 [Euzebyales bacterium]
MDDLVFVVVAIALFALSALYVRACAHLVDDSAAWRGGTNGDRR